ncbi:MAG: tyrosine recombinase XerC [Saprospiraceae bacterium]|nr:tyrosine recombinase XerC [Saprospiraceae bacterium]HPG06668.1 tyrosine recombinase XerC [Saprospiraceae bacterium]HPR00349.1 tyrosine recombinase XerC [Saprospiraceae bacterium]HQU55101.1 tyrosine recombinase XerC [Saprospiraceae bacterium]
MHLTSFLKYLEFEKRYSPHTVESYRNDIQQFQDFLQKQFETNEWADVTPGMVRSWMVSLAESGRANRSINRKISALQTFVKYLMRRGFLAKNPLRKVVAPKVGKRLPVYVQESQMESLLDVMKFSEDFAGVRDRLIIELFYTTGMRRSELVALQDQDIDLEKLTVKVMGKGSKERIIPIGPGLRELILRYRKLRDEIANNGQCWVTESGKPIYPKLIYNIVNKYLSMVSTLEKKSPHVLRHSFATHLANEGAELNAIKELLGHANLSATQVYTHNSIEQLRKVYEAAHPKS